MQGNVTSVINCFYLNTVISNSFLGGTSQFDTGRSPGWGQNGGCNARN